MNGLTVFNAIKRCIEVNGRNNIKRAYATLEEIEPYFPDTYDVLKELRTLVADKMLVGFEIPAIEVLKVRKTTGYILEKIN